MYSVQFRRSVMSDRLTEKKKTKCMTISVDSKKKKKDKIHHSFIILNKNWKESRNVRKLPQSGIKHQ